MEIPLNSSSQGCGNCLDNQGILHRISAEIEAKRNAPQELWQSLRGIFSSSAATTPPTGLLHDVVDFCLAVYDSLEPNASLTERNRRIAHVNGLVLPLNARIGEAARSLSDKNKAFLAKWGVAASINMFLSRRTVDDFKMNLSTLELFVMELGQADCAEQVLSIWLFSLYTAIFMLAHGIVPAGVLGLASFGLGLAMGK